jgi:hypothetical protein
MNRQNSSPAGFTLPIKTSQAMEPCRIPSGSLSNATRTGFARQFLTAIITVLCSLICLSSCQRHTVTRFGWQPDDESLPSLRYIYKDGPIQLRNEEADLIESDTGPAILNRAFVASGVIARGIDAINSDVGSLQIKGNAWIRKSLIRGDSCIGGKARYCDSQIMGSSTVHGEVHADNVNFEGPLCISGDLTARCTHFAEDIATCANVITFSSTCANTIYVSDNRAYCYDWQILVLKHGSRVETVVFESERGRVFCDDSSCCPEIIGGCCLNPHAGMRASPREFQ